MQTHEFEPQIVSVEQPQKSQAEIVQCQIWQAVALYLGFEITVAVIGLFILKRLGFRLTRWF